MNKLGIIVLPLMLGVAGGLLEARAQPDQSATATAAADIAAGSRILAELGVVDAFGHVSARNPVNRNRFFMARSLAPALVTPADIMEFDLEGSPVDAQGRMPFLERFIHSEIYKARPDVMAVVHTHSPGVIPFSAAKTTLRPIFHTPSFLGTGAPVWDIRDEFGDTDMLVRNAAIGRSLAKALGGNPVVLMRGHGDVTTGPSVKVAVFRAYYTDVNARLQAQAMALGGEITYLTAAEAAKADATNMAVIDRVWSLWVARIAPAVQK